MDIKYRNNYNAWDEKRVFLDIIHHDARGGKIIKMIKDNKNSVIHTSTIKLSIMQKLMQMSM